MVALTNTASFGRLHLKPLHCLQLRAGIPWKPGLGIVVPSAVWIAYHPVLDLLALVKDREALVSHLQGYGIWGPLLLGIVIGLQVTLAVLPGHILLLASGYLYGFGAGFLIIWIATVTASQFNFVLARSAGRSVVYRLAPAALLDRWHGIAQGKDFTFFLMTFVLPIFPSDLMAYVAGFTKISPRRFFVANLLGHLPCAVVASLIGAYGLAMPAQGWVMLLVLSAGGLLLWRLYGARLEARLIPGGRVA